MSYSKSGFLLGVPFIRVPHYIGDLKRDPSVENYPYQYSSVVEAETQTAGRI